MTGEIGIFKYRALQISNSSFIFLNSAGIKLPRTPKDSDVISVELRFGPKLEKVFYTSLGPFLPQVPIGHVTFSPVIASKIGVKEDDELLVTFYQATPVSVAYVRPKCGDDYNIMLNLQSVLENTVLDQVRIVAPGQIISLKVGNIGVDLLTENIKPPGKCGRLEKYTAFVVLDEKETTIIENTNTASEPPHKQSLTELLWNLLQRSSGFFGKSTENVLPEPTTNENRVKILKSAVKKKAPLDFRVLPGTGDYQDIVFTTLGFKTDVPTHCRITKMPEKTALQGNLKLGQHFIHSLVQTRLQPLDEKCRDIYLTEDIMEKLDVVVGSRVFVEEVAATEEKKSKAVEEKPEILKDKRQNKLKKHRRTADDVHLWPNLNDFKERLFNVIRVNLEKSQESNVLIVAPPGCGKTFLIKHLENDYSKQHFYCCYINCKELRGKKVESLLKIFTSKWSECAYREPSVLFLDDLDSLMMQDDQDEQEAGTGAVYSSKVATLLMELAESFQMGNRVCVIATASNLKNLLSAMSSTRGPRLFDLVVDIPEMVADDRKEMLHRLGLETNDDVIAKTQGYRIQDLLDLASKARLYAILSETSQVSLKEVEKAIEDTTPMSLLGVRLQEDVPYTWEDVGGMKEVKTVLDEIFRWPSQFPQVFQTCPLRLQSGALLFGPPGCGKTLVAGALANECGMNFIGVKGPEVLSKYVGASEAAVRDLFDRAARAQPCLLFFDELDSLAPRRGHDTTGVTDRVVNQMLTQLDGVESRTGVWVLGASSRPDLIDPALLRPGRLDRAVSCPLPSEEDRLQILELLSRNLLMAEDVKLSDLAAKTGNYSGADLQALLYNSHMKAVQGQADYTESNVELLITLRNVEDALMETKPSVSPSELHKYERLFKRFMNTRGPLEPPMKQRVTFM